MKSEKCMKVLYYEGEFDKHTGKFLNSIVNYLKDEIEGVISQNPTNSLRKFLSEKNIKLSQKIEDFNKFNQLIITTLHFSENDLKKNHNVIKRALNNGKIVINGSHTHLSNKFKEHSNKIIDLRKDIPHQKLFSGKIIQKENQKRILTVGMDCNIGKMTTSLEIHSYLKKRGLDVKFIATGHIGTIINKNEGISLDRSIVDFTSGVMEEYLLKHKNKFLIIEGQGSIFTPLFSGLTLSQIHGCAPDFMILCTDISRNSPRYFPNIKIPPIKDAINMYEKLGKIINSNSKIIGISINTSNLDRESSTKLIKDLEKKLKLPVFDVIRKLNLDSSMEKIKECISQY